MEKTCVGYWGKECGNGSCPLDNGKEYIRSNAKPVRNCDECHYNKGCDSCIERFCSERKE